MRCFDACLVAALDMNGGAAAVATRGSRCIFIGHSGSGTGSSECFEDKAA